MKKNAILNALQPTSVQTPIFGANQVKNNAGGFVYDIGKWKTLERFLILGTEGGTYYVKEGELTLQNLNNLQECIKEDAVRVVNTTIEISDTGRAIRNNPAIFALTAVLKTSPNEEARKLAATNFNRVIRTGTHRAQAASYINLLGGWGRATKRALAATFSENSKALAYSLIKYQSRDGWSTQDILRMCHPYPSSPAVNSLFHWATKGSLTGEAQDDPGIQQVMAFEELKACKEVKRAIELITQYRLPRECVPTHFLNERNIWAALMEDMPLGAILRNMNKMTEVGLISPLSETSKRISEMLKNGEHIKKARLHPMQVLVAKNVYDSGHGIQGKLSWTPDQQISSALEDAFYLGFDTIEPSGKNIYLAIDCSGSMGTPLPNLPGVSCLMGAAVTAMCIARSEKNWYTACFNATMVPISMTGKEDLATVVKKFAKMSWGGTNCSRPYIDAQEKAMKVDAFISITDSETWAEGHPVSSLNSYRNSSGIKAKSIVVGMTATSFSINDPTDPFGLDIIGCDTSTPRLACDFATSRL